MWRWASNPTDTGNAVHICSHRCIPYSVHRNIHNRHRDSRKSGHILCSHVRRQVDCWNYIDIVESDYSDCSESHTCDRLCHSYSRVEPASDWLPACSTKQTCKRTESTIFGTSLPVWVTANKDGRIFSQHITNLSQNSWAFALVIENETLENVNDINMLSFLVSVHKQRVVLS